MFRNKKLMVALFIILSSFSSLKKQRLNIVFVGDSITYGAGIDTATQVTPPLAAVKYLVQKKLPRSVEYNNQGRSGFTTVDYLPSGNTFNQVIDAAKKLEDEDGDLIFSIMLGTNDSAEDGPNGSPVSASQYHTNLKVIIDSLLASFPGSRVIIQYPIWYSPTTYNGSRYLQAGLTRLQSYFPEIDLIVKEYGQKNPGHVFSGSKAAFAHFKNDSTLFQQEKGKAGIFYLHPNGKGAGVLGKYWGESIYKILPES